MNWSGSEHRQGEFRFGSDSKSSLSAKGKNHPSFTIILRRQLPVNFDICIAEQESALKCNGDLCDNDQLKKDSDQEVAKPEVAYEGVDFALESAWQIWLLDDKETICTDWNVKKHGPAVNSGRAFWDLYVHTYDMLEKLDLKNLMIFRDRIEPKWEDKANIGGGRWYFDVSYCVRNDLSRKESLMKQNYWTHCMETVISGALGPYSNLIVGMILHFKSCKYRVSLWIRACDFNQVIQLGASLRKLLNLRCQLKFELHSATTGPASSLKDKS